MEQLTFLGEVDRNGNIYIPWRGTHCYVDHNYEIGQNLIVTLEIDDNTICAHVVKVELPTLQQLKEMKDELSGDWWRFEQIFRNATMAQKTRMLKALDKSIAEQNRRIYAY